jgi:phage tail-like protein
MALVDPTSVFKFGIEIQGVISGWFTECSGLSVKRGTITHKEGGVNDYVHKLPDRVEQSDITLRRGVAGNELWDWFQEGLYDAKVTKHNVSIILYSNDRAQAKRWNLSDAYPIEWTGPDFKVDSTQVAIETLKIVYHGIEMTAWTPV